MLERVEELDARIGYVGDAILWHGPGHGTFDEFCDLAIFRGIRDHPVFGVGIEFASALFYLGLEVTFLIRNGDFNGVHVYLFLGY